MAISACDTFGKSRQTLSGVDRSREMKIVYTEVFRRQDGNSRKSQDIAIEDLRVLALLRLLNIQYNAPTPRNCKDGPISLVAI